jgi:hypothetical protein
VPDVGKVQFSVSIAKRAAPNVLKSYANRWMCGVTAAPGPVPGAAPTLMPVRHIGCSKRTYMQHGHHGGLEMRRDVGAEDARASLCILT